LITVVGLLIAVTRVALLLVFLLIRRNE
jgi:hypothetical protein